MKKSPIISVADKPLGWLLLFCTFSISLYLFLFGRVNSPDPTDLLKKTKEFYKNLSSYSLEGVLQNDLSSGKVYTTKFKILFRKPNNFYLENIEGTTERKIWISEKGMFTLFRCPDPKFPPRFEKRPDYSKTFETCINLIILTQIPLFIENSRNPWIFDSMKFYLSGSESINGADCWLLHSYWKDSQEYLIWIDKKTFQIQKVTESYYWIKKGYTKNRSKFRIFDFFQFSWVDKDNNNEIHTKFSINPDISLNEFYPDSDFFSKYKLDIIKPYVPNKK